MPQPFRIYKSVRNFLVAVPARVGRIKGYRTAHSSQQLKLQYERHICPRPPFTSFLFGRERGAWAQQMHPEREVKVRPSDNEGGASYKTARDRLQRASTSRQFVTSTRQQHDTLREYPHTHTVFTDSVRTSEETHYVPATETNRLMLFTETIAVYCENRTEHTDTLCGQNAEFFCFSYVVHIVITLL
jgi:hypothetical protein